MNFDADITIFLIILGMLFISIIILLVHLQNNKLPKRTSVQLPQKLDFEKTTDNEYGLGTFVLDVFTGFGHGRLKDARYHYENQYFSYSQMFNESINLRHSINEELNNLGEYTYRIIKELQKSQKLLNRPYNKQLNGIDVIRSDAVSRNMRELQDTTTTNAHTGIILLQGSAIGGLAAVGSWTLVSILGTASTGTAIASLSGIAAHNAILAWFGGGALAVGGGGMAAGVVTLGTIVALPIVVFSAYKTHAKASEIETKTKKLMVETNELKQTNESLGDVEKIIKEQVLLLRKKYDKIVEVNQHVSNIIYPHGVISHVKRSIDQILNKNFYTQREAEALDQLYLLIDEAFFLLSNNCEMNSENSPLSLN